MSLEQLMIAAFACFAVTILVIAAICRMRRSSTATGPMDTASQLARWRKIYRDHFDIELGDVRIPERHPGFYRLIVVAMGVTAGQVFRVLGRSFRTWTWYDDIDGSLNPEREQRSSADGTYAIWVRDRVEVDEDLKNLSANDTAAQGLEVETLTERLLHGYVIYNETGQHLDRQSFTRCDGSRDSGGGVPGVGCDPLGEELYVVDSFRPDRRGSRICARPVVS